MNILVTGGAGFIGSHTVVALVEAGFHPVIIDDFSNSELQVLQRLETITGHPVKCYAKDCNNADTLREIFHQEDIRGVIHFAASKAVGESMQEPLKYYRNNVGSLITLLETMEQEGISNLIFSSSCTVYGQPEHLPVTEETPMQAPVSVYGNTKKMGEEILRDTAAAGKELKIISLRYFNPIGAHATALIGELPRGVPGNLVPFITQTAAGLRQELVVHGDDYPTPDGTCIRDYIHVMDLAEAHVAAMKKLLSVSENNYFDYFNVGSGQGASVMDIVKTFEAVSGRALAYRIGPRRAGDIVSTYANVDKANKGLQWHTRRTLREALEDAWRWQKQLSGI